MSYRCQKCNDVCFHKQIRVVTETRERYNGAREIAKELSVCEPCAVDLSVNVFNLRPTTSTRVARHESESSTIVGSA